MEKEKSEEISKYLSQIVDKVAEVNLQVTLPPLENAGSKSMIIYFKSE